MPEKLGSQDIKEVLKPQNTPEMAFESFFMLVGDKEKREKTKDDFLNGRIVNPKLDYPRINEKTLDEGIKSLLHILTVAENFDGDEKSAIWDSAAYRMADMYLLKSLLNLQTQVQSGNEQKINQASETHQRLNEELFGKPSEELTKQVFGEVFAQIKAKKLSESNLELLSDLKNGFSVEAAGEQIDIPVIYLETEEKLPVISEDVKNKLSDYIKHNHSDIFEIVNNYFNNYVANREEGQQVFNPVDIFTIFKIINTIRDPENTEGIGVILDDDSTTLSWDTAKMSIIIGNRRDPIKSKEQVMAVVMHEYGVHATRAVNGSKSKLPTLGTGLFTEADEGENVDYLTFEEGLATACEKAINPKKDKWVPLDIEKTMAICLAYKGLDFRQSFEALWRIRCLMLSKDGVDLGEETISKAKRNSYSALERIYRCTPSDLDRKDSEGKPRVITYNKDLAYLKGKLNVYKYLEEADESDIALAFSGKFDPTNKRQLAFAKKYL